VTSIHSAPRQRALDSFELAFNTILDPDQSPGDEKKEALLAQALNLEPSEAQAFANSGKPLPVVRSQTRQEAELIAALIRTCGAPSSVVSDEELKLNVDLARARRIERSGDCLNVHYTGGSFSVSISAVRLLVLGVLRNTRVDYIEARAGMRGQGPAVLDSTEFRSADTILDVYSDRLETSFRIKSDAFDYSGLVWPLSFQSDANFQSAIAALKAAIPHAMMDDDFAKVRTLLARAWPERSKVESRGVTRAGISHRPVAQSSVVSDNRDQFDRYSRLMFLTAG
jgi:hypothetical protein